jgi:hypothetical protein
MKGEKKVKDPKGRAKNASGKYTCVPAATHARRHKHFITIQLMNLDSIDLGCWSRDNQPSKPSTNCTQIAIRGAKQNNVTA